MTEEEKKIELKVNLWIDKLSVDPWVNPGLYKYMNHPMNLDIDRKVRNKMSKVIITKEFKIDILNNAAHNYKECDYNWDKSVYDYLVWSIKKWNRAALIDNKIQLDDLDITYTYLCVLKTVKFPKIKKDLTRMFCSGRISK